MDENKEREIVDILAKFYQSLIEPKIEGIRKKQEEHDLRFKEILGHFDSLYHRFERLQTEYKI